MTPSIDREFFSQSVIILAVCIGSWMWIVKPRAEELAAIQRTIAESTVSTSPLNPQTMEAAAKRMVNVRHRLDEIESFNGMANDTSAFYGLVMDLADTHGVQVQSLQPGAPKQSDDAKVTRTRVELTVEGPYENVASFLDAVTSIEAFIKPVSLQLTPTTVDGKPRATAAFACSVMKFAVADVLGASSGGSTDAQP